MCGINGFNWKNESLIEDMNRVTKHRGPDDEGVYLDDMFSLGHVRLSIIDLTEKRHQPMTNEDETIWIAYNGEIYNFQELREELIKKGHKFRWYTLIKEMGLYLKNFKNIFPHAMFIFLLLPGAIEYFLWEKFMNKWIKHELLKEVCNEKDPRWKAVNLNECLLLSLFSTAIPHLLRWEDKSSMRWSIECRVPFLDFVLVESANSLTQKQKLHDGKTKVMFKKAMNDILPEMIRNRTDKIGFVHGTPVDDFFRNEKIVAFCKEVIYSESFKKRPYWKWEEVEKMFIAHIENKKNVGDTIWKWINLEM